MARCVHQILGIRPIHHGKIRIEPDSFPIGAMQPIGHGVKGATQTVPSARLPVSPKALPARRNISSEALRVNVRSMIRPGSIPWDTSQATREARVLVLPVPAPAMVRTGPSPAVAARSCSGFRSSIRDSGMSP
jgi:hypothetical protein